jgi:hypothetical protein
MGYEVGRYPTGLEEQPGWCFLHNLKAMRGNYEGHAIGLHEARDQLHDCSRIILVQVPGWFISTSIGLFAKALAIATRCCFPALG